MSTHQQLFVSEVLAVIFHRTPEQFLALLARDGNKFLTFYWDEVAKKLPDAEKTSSFGINYDIRKPSKRVWVVLIRLPVPRLAGEAYVVALVFRPDRITPFLMIKDITGMAALEKSDQGNEPQGTLMVEWTRHLLREVIGPGLEPKMEPFYQSVLSFFGI